jgi:gluconate 2-dehydrogenase subunit 3-like protein
VANQSPDRREVLAMLARMAAISQLPVFSKWALGADSYTPRFFTPTEYRTLDVLCELIIPADETSGAHEAGVAEFIDFMVSNDDELQYPFRTGLAWLNSFAAEKLGKTFTELETADQEKLLSRLAFKSQQGRTEKNGQEFFSLARKYTVIGYYTSRIGLQQLDDPGLKFYSSSPECPHKGDPEHKHLAVAK